MTFKKKKKKGHSYCVTWDSDDSSSDDEMKITKKKALASIAINNKPSLFDTTSTCFMAKATKVQSDDESDSESESEDDEEPLWRNYLRCCKRLNLLWTRREGKTKNHARPRHRSNHLFAL